MAARSVEITLVNTTGQALALQATPPLAHGIWGTQPPATVKSKATFEAESNGTLTGVQGTVVYQIGGAKNQTVTLLFDNPFAGSDAFSAVCTPATAFSCAVTSNSGNNANVTFTLSAG